MTLSIYSPSECLFSGEVQAVFFPGTIGAFEVLKNHAPIISSLDKGQITFRTAEGEKSIDIVSGFVKNEGNEMIACVEI